MSSLLMTLSATAYNGPFFQEFTSPSGNIVCGGAKNYVTCIIGETKGKPPIPRSYYEKDENDACNFLGDYGNLFTLGGTGKAEMSCYSDVIFDPNTPRSILQYGQIIRGKNWQCTSTITGMLCENSQQRGFKLNRKKLTVF